MLRRRPTQNNGSQEAEVLVSETESRNMKNNSRKLFLKFVVAILFFLYVIIPFSIYLSPSVRRHAVFLHYVSLSRQRNLSMPELVGLNCAKNFYISSEDNIKLGVWHVPPHSMKSKCTHSKVLASEEFKDSRPVFLYLHGNAGTRGGGHRVELYKILSKKLDSHVVAFDYRGYGDSTNSPPSEGGVVQDTKHVYDWLCERVNSSRIFIWGHSLGTGVGVAFLEKLGDSENQPAALILEAPFTRIIDAAYHHPLSIFHRYMPFFDVLIAKPIGDKDTAFDSLSRIDKVKCPLLILHAEDDGFVPFNQGRELYEQAVRSRKHFDPHTVQFIGFDEKLDFGHKSIYKNPNLPNILKGFMKSINY